MKSTEIRLGNWYDHYGKPKQVTPSIIQDLWEAPRDWVKPIPMTEDWLFMFGFERQKGRRGYHIPYYRVMRYRYRDGYTYLFMRSFSPERIAVVNHVHQLQNLYHALTGQELTLKARSES